MAASKQIIVVGAGIIGASIAWHLTRAGAGVTIVEAGQPGGVATPASFAWINASWGNPEPYFRLRMRSIAEWTRLAAAVPDIDPGMDRRALLGPAAEATSRLSQPSTGAGAMASAASIVPRPRASSPISPNRPDFAVHVAGRRRSRAGAGRTRAGRRCGARAVPR